MIAKGADADYGLKLHINAAVHEARSPISKKKKGNKTPESPELKKLLEFSENLRSISPETAQEMIDEDSEAER